MVLVKEKIYAPKMIDLAFIVDCKTLIYDHAYELSNQITKILPWLDENNLNGIHMLHGPGEGNGWVRSTAEKIFLSKRTRLIIRIPKEKIELTKKLEGTELKVFDDILLIGKSYEKPLMPTKDLFSKFVAVNNKISEEEFLVKTENELLEIGISPKNVICGKTNSLQIGSEIKFTRSLMLPGLSKQESLLVQDIGLGEDRIFGCGLFLPHKSIDAISNFKEEE